jgi:hypothetical protein
MSDGIKKVTVVKQSLPPVGDNNEFYVRYRVVSDDKNRTSHWSQLYELESLNVEEAVGTVAVASDVATTVWEDPQENPEYDVFVEETGSEQPEFVGRTRFPSFAFWLRGKTDFRIFIQRASRRKERNDDLRLFISNRIVL